jgi:spore maturation protein CgeB
MNQPLTITILGLSVTSSWGNGHATTYRHLMRALSERGHDVQFLERERAWYAENRDLPAPPYGRTFLYETLEELRDRFDRRIAESDLTIVGSYVPEGIDVGHFVISTARQSTAFYDIDTPITLSKLRNDECDYISRELIPKFDLYLSFTGGPILDELQQRLGAQAARPLYCSVDETHYCPAEQDPEYDLGYMGTYSEDRQLSLERLLLHPAERWPQGRFIVAGPQYPHTIDWPSNVRRIEHLPPNQHPRFYNSQRFTLNLTRRDMIQVGYAPSIRLFEAAACGTPVISDYWMGLEKFFTLDREILVTDSAQSTLRLLREMPEEERQAVGQRARKRVLNEHTAHHRAEELEGYVNELRQASHL